MAVAAAPDPVATPASATRSSPRTPLLAVSVVAVTLLGVVMVGMRLGYRDVDVWGAFGVPVLLAGITIPAIVRSERGRATNIARLLGLALVLKFAGAYARYLMVFELYEGGDPIRYLRVGGGVAEAFWNGQASVSDLLPAGRGTEFIEQLSGLVQTVVGQTAMGSFMVFAWLSFLGMWAFVAAARRAVPTLDIRRYALLALFLPSMLFWPSSVGKDAWMVFTLGLFALGAARVFTHARGGFALLALGVGGMALVRPHVALLAMAGFAVAFVLRGRSSGRSPAGMPVQKVVGVVVLLVGFSFALSQASQLLPGFEGDGSANLTATLQATTGRSEQGGSEIEATSPNSPLEYPQAFLTVMFRPLLFEARSPVSAVAALESTALLVIAVASRRRIASAVRQAASEPYLLMAGLYTLGFAFAWSAIGNLGIIARQRVQVLPFLLLFISVQLAKERVDKASDEPDQESVPS